MLDRDIFFGTSGPHNADIAIVGESWGAEEEREKRPFVGQSGQELDRMLAEAGINRPACFATNVVSARPENNDMWHFFYPVKESPVPPMRGLHPMPIVEAGLWTLYEQLRQVKPKVILALGNYALWALTNCTGYTTPMESCGRRVPNGIMNWRGSQWYADAAPGELSSIHLVPAIHPAGIMRAWYNRAVTVHDFRERVAKQGLVGDWRPKPPPVVWAPPSYQQAKDRLEYWLRLCEKGAVRLVNDIENVISPPCFMTCMGFADSKHFAMSIPFVVPLEGQKFDSFWSRDEELSLLKLIRQLLSHPNCLVEGQNYLHDMQHIQYEMFCTPHLDFDSMLAQHLLFPGTPKGLDYLSSLYCKYHWFWKEDGKEWREKSSLEEHLRYNAEDCLRNFEVNTELRQLIPQMKQEENWKEELEKNDLALEMMNRGVAIDLQHKAQLGFELAAVEADMALWFEMVLSQKMASPNAKKGVKPWYRSPGQQRRFFSEDLGLRLPRHRKTERETFGHEALSVLRDRHPELTPLFNNIELYRSIRVFHNTFVKVPLSPDKRIRCMFQPSGTESFRWSSSENAFGTGTNLQNIPEGEEE